MKLDEKTKNILTGVLAAAILWVALTVTFTPDVSLENMLLSMVRLPGNLFQFVWDAARGEMAGGSAANTAENEFDQLEEGEMPLVRFDDESTPPTDDSPIIINPVDGINELPGIMFKEQPNG